MAKRKDTNKENEPDPFDEDEEESPSQKRTKRQVADGAPPQTIGRLALKSCSQKQTLTQTRRTLTIRPLDKLRPRGIYLVLGMGSGVFLAIR